MNIYKHTHKPAPRPQMADLNNILTNLDNQGYYRDLSNKNISGQTKPLSIGFFVPKICLASQAIKRLSTKHFTPYLLQGKTVISMAIKKLSYVEMSLQNTTAVRRICRVAADVAKRESRLIPFMDKSLSLKKTSGGLSNA